MSMEWTCHPDMEKEWTLFINECSVLKKNNSCSSRWFQFWSDQSAAEQQASSQCHSFGSESHEAEARVSVTQTGTAECSMDDQLSGRMNEPNDSVIDGHQLKQIKSLTLDLVDIFESANDILPADIREELDGLPSKCKQHLLNELQGELSDLGVYHLCVSLCHQHELGPWLNITSVVQKLLLPMVCGDHLKPAGAEKVAGTLQLYEKYPSIIVTHLLQPLLSNEITAVSQLEFFSRLVPHFSQADFTVLLRYFLGLCSPVLSEWQLSILNTMLSQACTEIVSSAVDSLIIYITTFLVSSASPLAMSESFASFVLAISKTEAARSIHGELSSVANQYKSFSKRAMLNAVKALGPR